MNARASWCCTGRLLDENNNGWLEIDPEVERRDADVPLLSSRWS
jgi:hypothetical protein